jgi:hypothetical protein
VSEKSDWLGPYPGYTSGERWNGWATPSFEHEVGLDIVEDWKATDREGMEAHYDAEHDQFCFRFDRKEDWECFSGVSQGVGVQTRTLYPIGAFCWIWEDEIVPCDG